MIPRDDENYKKRIQTCSNHTDRRRNGDKKREKHEIHSDLVSSLELP